MHTHNNEVTVDVESWLKGFKNADIPTVGTLNSKVHKHLTVLMSYKFRVIKYGEILVITSNCSLVL